VLLDNTPRSATLVFGAERRTVDLGTHHGLLLEGDTAAAGRDEECVVVYTSMITRHPHLSALSHRDVIANARSVIQTLRFTAADHCVSCLPVHTPQSFVIAHAAPLLAGARVSSMPAFDAETAIAVFEQQAGSTFVGTAAQVQAFVEALETRRTALHAPAFRLGLCLCQDSPQNAVLASRFLAVTGIELNCGYRLEWDAPG
jgi:acyl-CoA synthetase (AMP-forming)/AMP-acid ligase II